jgi:hypothetical protein
MRAHTTIISRRRRKARRRRAVALALGVCALAIPATASADPSTNDYSSVNALTGDPSESSQSGGGGAAVAAGHAQRTPAELARAPHPGQFVGPYDPSQRGSGSVASPYSGGPDYATPNSILGSDGLGQLAPVTGSPATSGEGFDWPSAAVGAGAAMALIALGGAVLLTVRRRTAISRSAPAS